MGIAGPVQDRAIPLRARLKHFQIVGKVRKSVFLDRGRKIAQLLPFRHLQSSFVTLLAQHPDQFIEARFVGFVLDKFSRILCLVDGAHSRSPFRI
jgi:hypothetical protein